MTRKQEMTARFDIDIAGVHRPLTSIEIAEDLESGLNSYGTCALAAKTIREQHAEIDRLQSRFDSKKFTHRQDCFGSQIDTHCIGCTMADREMYEDEIARLNRENSVLRDLLRDCADVIDTIAPENSDENMDLESLIGRIAAAINGKAGGLFDGGAK